MAGSFNTANFLIDSAGNVVGVVLNDSVYRLQVETKAVADAAGVDVIGSSATPAVIGTSYTVQAGFTDVQGYKQAAWYVRVTDKGTATRLDVAIDWSEDGVNGAPQGAESIAAGISTLNVYEAQYDISALTAPFSLPVIALPVIGPDVRVQIKADTGSTTEAYVRVVRQG